MQALGRAGGDAAVGGRAHGGVQRDGVGREALREAGDAPRLLVAVVDAGDDEDLEVEAPGEEVLMVAMRYVDGRWMVGGAEVQK